jgi:hypothetical protein
MENKLPFTSYDFWAYLSSGFLLLFAVDYVVGKDFLMRDSWTVVQGVIAFSSAYAVGHVVASISSLLLERLLVGKLLGYPRDILLGRRRISKRLKFLLPGYFSSFSNETRNLINAKAAQQNIGTASDSIFMAAHAEAKATAAVMTRMDNFQNMYGFCRNSATVGFLTSALLYWFWRWGGGPDEARTWSCAAGVLGFALTLRYLKFFRLYAVENLNSYAHTKEPGKSK